MCGNCGDVMTSAFNCNRCQSRTYREVKCPACKQVNRDLKGYSCRFCYTNLLMHLTQEGKKAAEAVKQQLEAAAEKPAAADNKAVEKPAAAASRTKSSASLMVSESGQHVVKTNAPSSSSSSSGVAKNATPRSSPPPSNCSPIVVQSSSDERSKDVDVMGNSDSDDGESPKKKTPVVLKIKKRTARALLSDSSSDEDDGSKPSRKMSSDGGPSSSSSSGPPEPKRRHPDTNPSLTTRPGHTFRARGAMSKSQKRMLKNFKNSNNNSSSRTSKLMTSPPIWNRRAEFDVTECRKPGPLSRTSYYRIHRAWNIDLTQISLPDDFRGMDTYCKVSLSPYPEERMQRIYTFQPSLKEEFSDKILYG